MARSAAEIAQLQKIVEDRRQHGISEVRHGHVPNWLRRKALKLLRPPVYRWDTSQHEAYCRIDRFCEANILQSFGFIDHWGSTKLPNGRIGFVTEPYATYEMAEHPAQKLSEQLGIDWFFSKYGWWYPGYTIRIVFHERLATRE